ncbi:MAG: hypothetical protein Q8M31_06460 [Beijerinckiaceae bacterium]|nr:hypothetical protein [Beijerinckiaceae bacterium]
MHSDNPASVSELFSSQLLLKPGFEDWLAIAEPDFRTSFARSPVRHRFYRNGFEWDIHGTLYEPAQERLPGVGFALFHGGAGSEKEFETTPDGRPGLASILAGLGFRCIAITYPGHIPASGEWTESVTERQPHYLLDQQLPLDEIIRRTEVCTYNTILAGSAELVDRTMADHRLISFGHSTGGPMSISLAECLTRASIIGIVGWGSGGPDGWYREWVEFCAAKKDPVAPPNSMARRDVASFKRAGYEDAGDLCPWGGAEEYFVWADRFKSQMKSGVCDNQHWAQAQALEETAKRCGLPAAEYLDHLRDPDPVWLARTGVLLLVGENDRNHWLLGDREDRKLEMFMGYKFKQRARNAKVVLIPRYGHFGFAGLHNEKIAYYWVHALLHGFFDGVSYAD